MVNNKLAQGTKELRKRKGFSQEELAENSGLSLRTIQRVENGETEPTGETLKRISSTLELTPHELINWDANKETLKKMLKARNEYLHIFDNKLIISKTPEINIVVEDYEKSVINVFKSLMVFIVAILVFTTSAIVFYTMGKMELVVHSGAYSFLFLNLAFFSMLFFSPGSSTINLEGINKIKIRRILFNNVVVIFHEESGRLKKRYLILEKGQVDKMKTALLSEKLIDEKDIELKDNMIINFLYVLTFMIIIAPQSLLWENAGDNIPVWMTSHGNNAIILSFILIILMLRKLIKPLFYRNKKTLVSQMQSEF